MTRVRKPKPTLESIFFVTPEQKLIRFLLSEPTSTFTSRVLSSKLKGVRGLGGAEGITKILADLSELGLVQFHDNNRAVSLHNDVATCRILKPFVTLCELEGLIELLAPISERVVLVGSRARSEARSDSDYNLVVISRSPTEVKDAVSTHPLGRRIEAKVISPDEVQSSELKSQGILLWGTPW